MRRRLLLATLVCACACGGRSGISPGTAGPDAGIDAPAPGPTPLKPFVATTSPPPGQVALDFSEQQGKGWDLCVAGALGNCGECIPPPDKTAFVLFSGGGEQDTDPSKSQAYAYFHPPASIPEGAGLWFELSFEGHQVEGATMTLFSVGYACETKSVLAVLDLVPILTAPDLWNRACVTLPAAVLEGLGFRFDGKAFLSIDTLRLGPACPRGS
jgi:hypothetical protein